MKHCGLINSDEVISRYQKRYDEMPTVYTLKTDARVPWWRRAWRWVMQLWG